MTNAEVDVIATRERRALMEHFILQRGLIILAMNYMKQS